MSSLRAPRQNNPTTVHKLNFRVDAASPTEHSPVIKSQQQFCLPTFNILDVLKLFRVNNPPRIEYTKICRNDEIVSTNMVIDMRTHSLVRRGTEIMSFLKSVYI